MLLLGHFHNTWSHIFADQCWKTVHVAPVNSEFFRVLLSRSAIFSLKQGHLVQDVVSHHVWSVFNKGLEDRIVAEFVAQAFGLCPKSSPPYIIYLNLIIQMFAGEFMEFL